MLDDSGYIAAYILRITRQNTVEPPDPQRLNGHRELAEALYAAHQKGGPKVAHQIWQDMVHHSPELGHLIQPRTKTRRILSAQEVKNLLPVDWLIPGMIPKRGLVEMHGAPSSGKSLAALHFAAQLSEQYSVLYVVGEGFGSLGGRITAWEHANKRPMSKNMHFDDSAVYLLDEGHVNAFIEAVKPYQPQLVIFDTLAMCIVGGDENSAKDMSVVVDVAKRIIRLLDTAVLIIHHTGKDRKDPRGSSALPAALDSMIFVNKQDQNRVVLECQKLRDGSPFEKMVFEIVSFESSVAVVPSDYTSKPKVKANHQKILDCLQAKPNGMRFSDLKQTTGLTDTTFDRAIKHLKTANYIVQNEERGPYILTEKGREILNHDRSGEPITTPITPTPL